MRSTLRPQVLRPALTRFTSSEGSGKRNPRLSRNCAGLKLTRPGAWESRSYDSSSYPTTLKLKNGVLITPNSCSHMGIIISGPRAVVMSPRSMRCCHP